MFASVRNISRKFYYVERFHDASSEQLVLIWKEYEQYAGREAQRRWWSRIFQMCEMPPEDHILYRAAAAAYVLRERHGDKYFEELTGFRLPQSRLAKFLSRLELPLSHVSIGFGLVLCHACDHLFGASL